MTKNLKRWDWGFCNTAYFYFQKWHKLLCIEYWTDEEKIAPCGQYFSLNGEEIEGYMKTLSDKEITKYTKFCKSIIDAENNNKEQ